MRVKTAPGAPPRARWRCAPLTPPDIERDWSPPGLPGAPTARCRCFPPPASPRLICLQMPRCPWCEWGDSQRRRGLPECHHPLGHPAGETGNPAPAIYTPAHLISPTFNALIGADTLVK